MLLLQAFSTVTTAMSSMAYLTFYSCVENLKTWICTSVIMRVTSFLDVRILLTCLLQKGFNKQKGLFINGLMIGHQVKQ